ncbi:hypothetical protein GCE9029_01022 [Grimontia celer]|uniref:Lipoprotein n=1 Tax=Grimontia celer TaxID=1796497 RepID=A0A128EVW6_9GAMM|nr:hypothetical protein [Grimontia celer]CZF78732.1 hypothetical protein GCE9029_01022 [Grimontia celer]
MQKVIVSILAVLIVGCASSPKESDSQIEARIVGEWDCHSVAPSENYVKSIQSNYRENKTASIVMKLDFPAPTNERLLSYTIESDSSWRVGKGRLYESDQEFYIAANNAFSLEHLERFKKGFKWIGTAKWQLSWKSDNNFIKRENDTSIECLRKSSE